MNTPDYSTLMPMEQQALETLTAMNNIDYPSITESRFVNVYLPILTYNLTRPESEHIRVPTEIWVKEVSKSPYYIVNVVSDTDPSVKLFWVPPVLRTGGVFQQTAARDSFFEVMLTASKKGQVMPRAKDAHLNQELGRRLNGNVSLSEDQKQWFYITSYYGMHQYGTDTSESPFSTIDMVADAPDNDVLFGDVDEL